mmetsp:Transcript_21712/g.42657  ORF Transcript_21712/g.42657 Transcript_21712/m.42657 type:complete len:703 (+) Transcript_21712:512-2620(+)
MSSNPKPNLKPKSSYGALPGNLNDGRTLEEFLKQNAMKDRSQEKQERELNYAENQHTVSNYQQSNHQRSSNLSQASTKATKAQSASTAKDSSKSSLQQTRTISDTDLSFDSALEESKTSVEALTGHLKTLESVLADKSGLQENEMNTIKTSEQNISTLKESLNKLNVTYKDVERQLESEKNKKEDCEAIQDSLKAENERLKKDIENKQITLREKKDAIERKLKALKDDWESRWTTKCNVLQRDFDEKMSSVTMDHCARETVLKCNIETLESKLQNILKKSEKSTSIHDLEMPDIDTKSSREVVTEDGSNGLDKEAVVQDETSVEDMSPAEEQPGSPMNTPGSKLQLEDATTETDLAGKDIDDLNEERSKNQSLLEEQRLTIEDLRQYITELEEKNSELRKQLGEAQVNKVTSTFNTRKLKRSSSKRVKSSKSASVRSASTLSMGSPLSTSVSFTGDVSSPQSGDAAKELARDLRRLQTERDELEDEVQKLRNLAEDLKRDNEKLAAFASEHCSMEHLNTSTNVALLPPDETETAVYDVCTSSSQTDFDTGPLNVLDVALQRKLEATSTGMQTTEVSVSKSATQIEVSVSDSATQSDEVEGKPENVRVHCTEAEVQTVSQLNERACSPSPPQNKSVEAGQNTEPVVMADKSTNVSSKSTMPSPRPSPSPSSLSISRLVVALLCILSLLMNFVDLHGPAEFVPT